MARRQQDGGHLMVVGLISMVFLPGIIEFCKEGNFHSFFGFQGGLKGGLILESFLLWLKSPPKGAKTITIQLKRRFLG